MSTKLDFQLKLLVYQKQSYRSSKMLLKPQSVSFFSYIVFCHQVQGHFHLDKSIVP